MLHRITPFTPTAKATRVAQNKTPRFGHLDNRIPTLFTDLDGTWAKDLDGPLTPERQELQSHIRRLMSQGNLQLVYITARPANRVLSVQGMLEPTYTVTENGSFIFKGLPTPDKTPDADWHRYLLDQVRQDNFSTQVIEQAARRIAKQPRYGFHLTTIGDLFGKEMDQNSPFQSVLLIPDADKKSEEQLQAFKDQLAAALKRKGMKRFVINSYPYHGKPYTLVDIMTPAANKGDALRFLKDKFRLLNHMVTVSADGGNDGFMFVNDGRYGVVVGANEKLRAHAAGTMEPYAHLRLQPSDQDPSLGVSQALKHCVPAMQWEDYYYHKGG